MRISGLINVLRWFVVAMTLPVSIGAAPASRPQPAQSIQAEGTVPLVIPARRSPSSPPVGPAALPAAAEHVTPLTLQTQVRRQAGKRVETVRQTVTRTADRIHVASSDGREWLFERNTRDSRRAFGTLIDHANRVLVFYDESDLRNMLGIRGWAQVLSLGLDHELLQGLAPGTASRAIDTVRVVRHATTRTDVELREVWWSESHFLPGGFTSRQAAASLKFSIEGIRPGVDAVLLRPAPERFPKYRQVDLAEWLER
jgi:hypothetical protein